MTTKSNFVKRSPQKFAGSVADSFYRSMTILPPLSFLIVFLVIGGVAAAQESPALSPPQLLPPRSPNAGFPANSSNAASSDLPASAWNADIKMVPLLPPPQISLGDDPVDPPSPLAMILEVDESGEPTPVPAVSASEDDWFASDFDSLPDTPTAVAIATNAGPETLQFSPELSGWISWLVRQYIPPTYEDTRKWGRTKEVFDGWDISREGLKIETRRKRKTVNAGTWTRYKLELVDPDTRLKVVLTNLQTTPDNHIRFDTTIETPLHITGRLSQWQRDVQLISLSADADAIVRMTVSCDVFVEINPLKVPPDIGFKPTVIAAQIELAHFRVNRISQIHGPLAKHLGNGLREALEDYLENYKEKLPEKINKQIAKKQDRLHISMADWLSSNLRSYATPVAQSQPANSQPANSQPAISQPVSSPTTQP